MQVNGWSHEVDLLGGVHRELCGVGCVVELGNRFPHAPRLCFTRVFPFPVDNAVTHFRGVATLTGPRGKVGGFLTDSAFTARGVSSCLTGMCVVIPRKGYWRSFGSARARRRWVVDLIGLVSKFLLLISRVPEPLDSSPNLRRVGRCPPDPS